MILNLFRLAAWELPEKLGVKFYRNRVGNLWLILYLFFIFIEKNNKKEFKKYINSKVDL